MRKVIKKKKMNIPEINLINFYSIDVFSKTDITELEF